MRHVIRTIFGRVVPYDETPETRELKAALTTTTSATLRLREQLRALENDLRHYSKDHSDDGFGIPHR